MEKNLVFSYKTENKQNEIWVGLNEDHTRGSSIGPRYFIGGVVTFYIIKINLSII